MNNNHPWHAEIFRFLLLIVAIIVFQQLTHQWSIAIIVGLAFYILFILLQLQRIYLWLKSVSGTSGAEVAMSPPEVDGILGVIVTHLQRNRRTIEKIRQQQKATRRQFDETISAIPSATIILSEYHEIEWANYPSLSLLGINGQRDIGIKIELLLRDKDFINRLNKDSGEQFEMISPVSPEVTLVVQIVRFSHRKRLVIAHNITPHIELQRSRKNFIANASHELRTPLTVINGYLHFMQSDPDVPASFQLPLDNAVEQSESMQVLINDLLVLSRLEDKNLNQEQVSSISLRAHVDKILQTLEVAGSTKRHKIVSHVDDGLVIEACEKELDSVCLNLINNAIKYSRPDTKITISWLNVSGTHAKFSVVDQGQGIAPEHIVHLTERFYRVDSGRSKRVGGTGLGLSIVKHIVERHHGRLEIQSRVGEGSEFSVLFHRKLSHLFH